MSEALRQLRARAGAMPPWHLDALVAAVVGVLVQVELLVLVGGGHPWAQALGLAIAAGVLLRRRAPELCVVLVGGAVAGLQQIPSVYDGAVVTFFVLFLATYSLGAHLEGRRLALGLGVGAAMVLLIMLATAGRNERDGAQLLFGLVVVLGGPALIGSILRSRAGITRALREKAQRAEAERARHAAEAVEDERTRIAGELHDVVAHALSAMVVQAAAARRRVDADPGAAAGAFAAVEHSGREALTEIRSLLGVLRREDEEIALAPQPSLAHAGSLARRMRAAGLGVELTIEGQPRELAAGVDLTAFRVVQAALGEALDPGGAGSAAVRVVYGPADVQVEVSDDGSAAGERALLGVRERVALYGGEVRALRAAAGRHVVRARIPAGSPA